MSTATTERPAVTHPIYARVAALAPRYPWAKGKGPDGRYGEDPSQPPLAQYLTTTEVAKLLRERLKREFPGARFSVRTEEYSMGSSVTVRWSDGPEAVVVERVANSYAFSGFDGMIDLQFSHEHWLLPNGSLSYGKTRGTVGSRGCVEAREREAPCPEAILVSGGPDYVNCYRD